MERGDFTCFTPSPCPPSVLPVPAPSPQRDSVTPVGLCHRRSVITAHSGTAEHVLGSFLASQLPSSQDWGLPRHALGLLCAGFSSRGRLSSSSFGPHTVFQMHPVFPQFHFLVPVASGSALLNMLAHSLGTETLSPCSSSGFLCL